MRCVYYILYFIVGAIIPLYSLYSQDQEEFNRMMESNFPLTDDATNYEEIYELLYQHYRSPIDLNTVDRNQLEELNLLTNEQISAFLNYRASNGRLLSVFELQAIPTFDLFTIRKIKAFVGIVNNSLNNDNRKLWTKILEEKNSYLIIRADRTLESKAGYDATESPAKYIGDPYRLYTKLRIQHTHDFSLGFTAEKDAGEQFKWNSSKKQFLYDFYSFHFQLKNKGRLQNILIGDYQIQYGQSLVFGAGFSLGKGSHAISTARRPNAGISPYGSVMEQNFYRGIANTLIISPKLTFTSFYSNKGIDAVYNFEAIDSTKRYIQSVNSSGLHQTVQSLERKNNARLQHAGFNLLFSGKQKDFNLGLNGLYTQFESPIQKKQTKYNQYTFSGKDHLISSLFSNYYWRNAHIFSEVAYSSTKSMGTVTGVILTVTNSLQLSMVARYYQRGFHSPMGAAFGEKSINTNESGIYIGLRNAFNKKVTLSTYVDKFKSPWLQYLTDRPANGFEHLTRLNFDINKGTSFYLQYRQKLKSKNIHTDSLNTYQVKPTSKRNVLMNLSYKTGEHFTFRSRVQFSDYIFDGDNTSGMALIQDVNYRLNKIRVSGRYAIFDTEDFENRQYAYEKDVLYAFSIPAYQNIGTRAYLMVQYRLSKNIKIWAKWSRFRYFNQETVGSGQEMIKGDTKTDIKFQILFKL